MDGQIDGAVVAPPRSERDMRAIRRGMGIPVPNSPDQEFLTEGMRRSKRRMESDTEFDEYSSSDPNATSDDEYHTSKKHRVAGQSNSTGRANTGRVHNMVLLQDSKFSADRTDMRLWHELRYVRSLWSREKEDKLRQDCAAITDGDDIQSTSNAVLWTAAFDRYGVPLSDIFTYGIRPHPSNLRFARKKLLSPQFCDHLTSVMVHPIFQGDAALLRYVLQLIVRMRVGMHVPPIGTMPDMDNATLCQVDLLADTLLLEEDTPEERLLVHADAYLLISQKQGARFHPDIVMLEDLLIVHFSNEGYEHTAPRDDAPYSRCLFYLQLWDLQFLLNVLDGLSFRTCYLPVDRYKAMWITDTPKIQEYIAKKLDGLVQQWFLSDERNYRIRQNLKHENRGTRLYDIAEEDFNPTYARSQYVTHKMRAVLEGEYLEALCPPRPLGIPFTQSPVTASSAAESPAVQSPVIQSSIAQSPIAQDSIAGTPVTETPVAKSDATGIPVEIEEEPGSGFEAVQFPVNLTSSPRDIPIRRVEENTCTNTAGAALDDQRTSPEAEVKLEAESSLEDKVDGKNGDDDGAYDGDADDSEDDDDQVRSRRKTSLVSIQSITSSQSEDDQRDSPYRPGQGRFPRRGLPPSDPK
ncbi:hypothetical protein INS49_011929 [Diaporthe citri]|uniref:uncharacterized protein n=1 Tax=Diaporthe citri TaxID=83186 RepID=UPI001C82680F|nr:uncharacterized protein INS49_011929 [Diaporthe citri]KAG6360862.1 hypothetical protein INS49_011929 [Diaporthe citri]